LVIGIIAILAGIVIVAINPSKQLATVRNTQRKSDLKQIYNAITQYYIDNSAYPSTISTTTLNEVCNTGSVAATTTALNGASCDNLANLSVLVPTYLVSIPTDPTGTSSLLAFIPTAYAATTATGTGYKVGINTAKQVLISAPLAELGVTVTVGNVPVAPTGCSATGGTISTTTGYKIHTFTTSGTFTPTGNCNVEVLVVAGGGAAGTNSGVFKGGGGGAGGYLATTTSITAGTHEVTVGSGGVATSGGNSVFYGLTAIGGGKGGNAQNGAGSNGGSGGGGGAPGSDPGSGTGGQGYSGGGGSGGQNGGAGGSAGGTPLAGWQANCPQADGILNNISGTGTIYSVGGMSTSLCTAPTAVPNSGNGGHATNAGSTVGQAGIVIVRYAN
jgi:type II secretory pathway pseudopilin PulG